MIGMKPMLDDGGGGAVDESDNDRDYETRLEPPGRYRNDYGVTLMDTPPGNPNPWGVTLMDRPTDADPAPDYSLGYKFETRIYGEPQAAPERAPAGGRQAQHPGFNYSVGSGLGSGPSMPISPDAPRDYQFTFSFPLPKSFGRIAPGPSFSVQFGWGESGYAIGGQAGVDFLPLGLAGVSMGGEVNLTDPWRSGVNEQLRFFNITASTDKLTARDVLDSLRELERQINNLYSPPAGQYPW